MFGRGFVVRFQGCFAVLMLYTWPFNLMLSKFLFGAGQHKPAAVTRSPRYRYLQGGCQEDGAKLFSLVPSDRTRGNRHKLKQRKFQLNMRKNFFPLRVTEPWSRLPREAVESPSLEIFQPRLDTVLCSLLWVTLLWQGVGLGDPQRSLSTLNIL